MAANVTGTYGSINIAANGAYTYTVDSAAVRRSPMTYTTTSTTQITVTIQGANDAPTAVADTDSKLGTSNVPMLTNDTDPDSAGNGETKTVKQWPVLASWPRT